MHRSRETRKKALNFDAKASHHSHVCAQNKRIKQLSKSLGDLPNFKKEIDEKLRGNLPKSSPRSHQTRRLGETRISPKVDDMEAYLVTRDCICVLQPKINGEALHLQDRYTFTPPPSREAHYERLKEIAKESANSTNLNSMRQKTLKVDDIVHSASKLEAEYLKRAKSPVYKTNYSHGSLYGNYSSVEGQENSEQIKPNSRRTLVVKIPAISDTLSEHDYRGGWNSNSNFSYRHKK